MHTTQRARSTRTMLRKTGERRPMARANGGRRSVETPAKQLPPGHLQTETLEEYWKLLRRKKAELVAVLQRPPGGLSDLGRVSEDDQSPLIHSEFIEVRVNQISRDQLGLVDAALARLESGEYGTCLLCERPIAAKRLAAVPWASHCVRCQEKLMQ